MQRFQARVFRGDGQFRPVGLCPWDRFSRAKISRVSATGSHGLGDEFARHFGSDVCQQKKPVRVSGAKQTAGPARQRHENF
jgi:hypothetical protein